jgi:hypothetical protein
MTPNVQPIVAVCQQLNCVLETTTLQLMVVQNKAETREAFSRRFNAVLDERGDCPEARGRRQWVAKRYKVSVETARKWLSGLDMPDGANSARICNDLKVNENWLRAGTGPPREPENDPTLDELTRTWPSLDPAARLEVLHFARFRKSTPPRSRP